MHGAVLQLRYMAIQAISLCNNNLLEIKGYESRLQKNNVLPGRHQILYMCCSLLDLQDLEPANCTSRDTTLLQALVSSMMTHHTVIHAACRIWRTQPTHMLTAPVIETPDLAIQLSRWLAPAAVRTNWRTRLSLAAWKRPSTAPKTQTAATRLPRST